MPGSGNMCRPDLVVRTVRGRRVGQTGRVCKGSSVDSEHPTADPISAPATSVPGAADPFSTQSGDPGQSVRELAHIPAVEVITRASVMLMSAAAEKLGLAEDGEQFKDLDEARRLIEAYAGLLGAAQADLGVHRQPLRDGLKALQAAFAEASRFPDEPGQEPGAKSGF